MSKPPTMDKEQLTLLHEIHAMVREHKVELIHVKEQTTKTNGRVNKHDTEVDDLKAFQVRTLAIYGLVNKHDTEIDDLKAFQVRTLAIWGVIISIVVFLANKFI